jgi:PilZ domain-containing protein
VKREARRAVEMRGYIVRANNEIVDVRILDLSYNGCGVETIVPLPVGERVHLSALGRGAVWATVQWYRARKAGLLFLPAKVPDKANGKRASRTAISAEALLRRTGKRSFRVTAFDLSTTGCKCEFVERPNIHERVWLKFAGLESLEAEVAWISGFHVGLTFCNPIHSAVFDMLVERLRCSSEPAAQA